jgi:glucodextranase-like protein
MHFRIGSVLAALALVVSMATVALAQSDNDTPSLGDAVPADTSVAEPALQPSVAPALFLTLANPVEQDVELPLQTAQLTIQGTTLPGAVVSIDGDLVDTDDQGNFDGVAALDEGANEVEIVASDGQGNQISTSIFVTRGE